MKPDGPEYRELRIWGAQTIVFAMCLKAYSVNKATDVSSHMQMMGDVARAEAKKILDEQLRKYSADHDALREYSKGVFEWCNNHMTT